MHFISPIKILHKHCFQFLLGRLQYPGEMKNKGYAKFGGGGGGKCGALWEMWKWHIGRLPNPPPPPEICVKP